MAFASLDQNAEDHTRRSVEYALNFDASMRNAPCYSMGIDSNLMHIHKVCPLPTG